MAEQKKHKQEAPNPSQPTPQIKKVKDLRTTGLSIREIAEKLKITRKKVEKILSIVVPAVEKIKKTVGAKDATQATKVQKVKVPEGK